LHHRGGRALVAAMTACALIAPAAGSSATPKLELHRTHRRLHDLRRDLSSRRTRAAVIKDRIDDINRDMARAQIAMDGLDGDIERIEIVVAGEQARIDRAQAEIDALRDVAADQAVMLYKAGATDALDAIFDAHSITELDDRIRFLGIAARANTGALVRYGRLQISIEMSRHELFGRERELAEARRAYAAVLHRNERLRHTLGRQLRRLDARIGTEVAREGHLERAAAKLRDRIIQAQAARSAASLGTSSRGFIWPLNGPVTSPFGPRWGSIHTGIDIDGYTGQPIVAAKDGRVIYLGSTMTGYGNTVVVDHGGGISSLYAHMSAYEVSAAAAVKQGQVIGYVGCTGHCYGDHLHFEVRVDGNPVNPLSYLP
jgi:peptidoglycan DL-endopeptidase CwlO